MANKILVRIDRKVEMPKGRVILTSEIIKLLNLTEENCWITITAYDNGKVLIANNKNHESSI